MGCVLLPLNGRCRCQELTVPSPAEMTRIFCLPQACDWSPPYTHDIPGCTGHPCPSGVEAVENSLRIIASGVRGLMMAVFAASMAMVKNALMISPLGQSAEGNAGNPGAFDFRASQLIPDAPDRLVVRALCCRWRCHARRGCPVRYPGP